jgi:hypothetical protein
MNIHKHKEGVVGRGANVTLQTLNLTYVYMYIFMYKRIHI